MDSEWLKAKRTIANIDLVVWPLSFACAQSVPFLDGVSASRPYQFDYTSAF